MNIYQKNTPLGFVLSNGTTRLPLDFIMDLLNTQKSTYVIQTKGIIGLNMRNTDSSQDLILRYITIMSLAEFAALIQRIKTASNISDATRSSLMRFFIGPARKTLLSCSGKIKLDECLLHDADISQKVLFAKKGNKIQIFGYPFSDSERLVFKHALHWGS